MWKIVLNLLKLLSMGYKSRGAYKVGICLKACANRDKKCDKCLRFSEYKPLKEEGKCKS